MKIFFRGMGSKLMVAPLAGLPLLAYDSQYSSGVWELVTDMIFSRPPKKGFLICGIVINNPPLQTLGGLVNQVFQLIMKRIQLCHWLCIENGLDFVVENLLGIMD